MGRPEKYRDKVSERKAHSLRTNNFHRRPSTIAAEPLAGRAGYVIGMLPRLPRAVQVEAQALLHRLDQHEIGQGTQGLRIVPGGPERKTGRSIVTYPLTSECTLPR